LASARRSKRDEKRPAPSHNGAGVFLPQASPDEARKGEGGLDSSLHQLALMEDCHPSKIRPSLPLGLIKKGGIRNFLFTEEARILSEQISALSLV
jgi:hypothetical protein